MTDQAEQDVVHQDVVHQDVADEVVADEVVADEVVADEVVADEVVDEVVADEVVDEPQTQPREALADAEPIELNSPATSIGVVEHQESETESVDEDVDEDIDGTTDESDDDYADAVSDYAAHIQQRETDVDVDFFAPPRRSSYAPSRFDARGGDAEEMSPDPDPVEDDTALDWSEADAKVNDDDDIDALDTVGDPEDDAKDPDGTRPYLRSTTGTLFGGQTVADDLARGGTSPGLADIETDGPDHGAETAQPKAMSSFMHGVWIVGQCVLAVAFGAGLFVAFDQLWKWNNIVALVLSVLVILGLVVGVRVVRKTEDIGSTLIAVAVGALVTLGPLALLQSG
ncbi:MAG: hypothetical protein ACXWZX_11905 [Mycobacterium sp.]